MVCVEGGYSGGYKMVWQLQYCSCVSIHRHYSTRHYSALASAAECLIAAAAIPLLPQLLLSAASPTTSTSLVGAVHHRCALAPSHHLLNQRGTCIHPLSASLLRSLHADVCICLPPCAYPHSIPHASSLRIVPNRRGHCTTRYVPPGQPGLLVAESGAWFFLPFRMSPFHRITSPLSLSRILFDVAHPPCRAPISTSHASICPSSTLFPPLSASCATTDARSLHSRPPPITPLVSPSHALPHTPSFTITTHTHTSVSPILQSSFSLSPLSLQPFQITLLDFLPPCI